MFCAAPCRLHMTLVFGEMAVSGEDCCILARKSQQCGKVKKSKRGGEKKHGENSKHPTSIESKRYSLPDGAPRGIVASRSKKLDNGSIDLRIEAVGMVARLVKRDKQVVEEVDLVPRGRGQSRSRIRG